MAVSEWYVNYQSGDDSTGDGTSPGTAYKTYANLIATETFDATNGVIVHMGGNQLEPLSASIGWGTPSISAFLWIVGDSGSSTGFSTAAGYLDGFQGYVNFVNLELTQSSGSFEFDGSVSAANKVIGCTLHGFTKCRDCYFIDCHIYNCSTSLLEDSSAYNCFLDNYNGSNHATNITTNVSSFCSNRILMHGSTASERALDLRETNRYTHNTIYCPSGLSTGRNGIYIFDAGRSIVMNNLIVSESANTGDIGINDATTNNREVAIIANNAIYNWSTPTSLQETFTSDNESLGSNPFSTAPTGATNDVDAWEPDVTGGNLDQLRSLSYLPSYGGNYKGTWQPASAGGGGAIVNQGLHAIESGITA